MLRQNPRKFVYYFCSRHGKIVALQVHLLGRLFIDASDLISDSYFSVSPTLSAFSLLLSYLCLLRGFICVYKIHLYSLFSKNLRMLIKNPISYFHIGTFLFSGKKRHLLECWKAEVIMRDKFVFHRLIRNGMQRQRGFLLWWRLANEMYISGNKKQRKCAIKIKNALMAKYGCDIGLGAQIGKGLVLPHHSGIVIHGNVKIGENVIIRQNTTIGEKESDSRENYIVIGDNVDIGAHTCIIGLNVKIGSNVKIGAMSFIMEEVPDNCTYVTRKESRVIMR